MQANSVQVFPFWVSCPEAHGFPALTLHGMVHWLVPQTCHEIKIVQHSFYLHCDLQSCEGLGQADVVPVRDHVVQRGWDRDLGSETLEELALVPGAFVVLMESDQEAECIRCW